jgi:TadE-like protein
MGTKTRRNQLGQAIVEIAIAAPVLISLLLGTFDAAVLVSDKVIAGAACRQGARLGAELGGTITNTIVPAMTVAEADAYITKNVLAVAKAMNYSTIKDIYIYSPTQADGNLPISNLGTPTGAELVDHFTVSGSPGSYTATLVGGYNLTLDQRLQVPPTETPIGVKLRWAYAPPTGLGLNINLTEYAVFLSAPVLP